MEMRVVVIDDAEINVVLLCKLLDKLNACTAIRFTEPGRALDWCQKNTPDLVFVDYMMPEMHGVDFISRFRQIPACLDIPILMITANDETAVRYEALEAGANDFLNKPIDKIEFLARTKNMLALRKNQRLLENRAVWLDSEVKKATAEIKLREKETILRLSRAADSRDPETGAHILRMANYSRLIATNLGLSDEQQQMVLDAAPMHDIGKVGIPDHILLKPGKLTPEEFAIMKTYTLSSAGVSSKHLVALGLLGQKIVFAHGSFGGWKPFGPTRKVTRCVGNILYELDGEPALAVYKRYLGDYARELPGSGLLFPFEMLSDAGESLGQIRTILGVDEEQGSLVLAGVINPDGYLRLMHAHTNDLVDGAETAAHATIDGVPPHQGQALGLLVSCVGRKLVMGGRVDEEVEAVQDVLGASTVLCGFYSNGEICPGYQLEACSLHNQTMTITYLAEAV